MFIEELTHNYCRKDPREAPGGQGVPRARLLVALLDAVRRQKRFLGKFARHSTLTPTPPLTISLTLTLLPNLNDHSIYPHSLPKS